MSGIWWLTLRHLRAHPTRTVVMVASLAIALVLPLAAGALFDHYEADLRDRADGTPLVLGARGKRFDLVLSSLWFRPSHLDPVRYGRVDEIDQTGLAVAVPIHSRFTARGHPIVATSREYYELRRLAVADGRVPAFVDEALLGANVAAATGLGVGDALFSDPEETYDISKGAATKLRVRGVLARSGGPDDDAVFVDVKTAWVLEGIAHGHTDAEALPDDMLLGRSDERIVVSPALIEHNELTADNAVSFHIHGDPADLAVTAILVFPRDEKSGTILKTRINAEGEVQVLTPSRVVDDLISFVFRIKRVFDAVSLLLLAATVALVALILVLSSRMRVREMEALHRIGASRLVIAGLHLGESAFVVVGAMIVAAAMLGAALAARPDIGSL